MVEFVRRVDGYDLSRYQTVTDWPAVASQVRLVSHKATEGRSAMDRNFRSAWSGMRAADVEFRGAYHWIRSDSTPAEQVTNLYRVVGPLQRGEFIQLDWETTPGIAACTVEQVETWLKLCDAMFGADRTMVYSASWVPGFIEWRQRNPDRPLWYANYNRLTGPIAANKYRATILQWSSTYQPPAGIIYTSGVDVNHVYDWATVERLTQTAPLPPPVPDPVPPAPQPEPPQGDDMSITLLQPAETGAAFFAYTVNGVALQCEWTGPGDDPKVAARIAAHMAAGMKVQPISLADLANVRLLGSLPVGDGRHVWTGDEFANTAELQTAPDPAIARLEDDVDVLVATVAAHDRSIATVNTRVTQVVDGLHAVTA